MVKTAQAAAAPPRCRNLRQSLATQSTPRSSRLLVLRRSVCLIMTEPPGFHVANVHAVEAGYRQDRLHDALGILLSGFTVRQKASQPLTVATMPLSFSPLSGSESLWVYFNHSWPDAEILIRICNLAGAYYPGPITLS